MKRILLVIIALAAMLLPPTVSTAWAQEEGLSSLEEGASVRRLTLLRSNRFELQPLVSATINDPFVRNISVGAAANYYFNNALGVGADFVYSPVHMDTDETSAVADENFRQRVREQLQVAELSMAFDAGVIWAPLSGKFSLFGTILNYDLHLFGGVGALMMTARCAAGDGVCGTEINSSLEGLKLAGAVGAGARVFLSNSLALNFEMRDFLASRSEYARSTTEDKAEFQNYFMGSVGLSIFFPFDVYMSR